LFNGFFCRSLGRFRCACLLGKLFPNGFRGDIVNRTGSAFHLKAAFAEKIEKLGIIHSDLFGKLVDSYAHAMDLSMAYSQALRFQ
jgi:hypothetical protein